MRIHVRFFGPIRRPEGFAGFVDLPDGALVADLLAALGYGADEARHVLVSHQGSRLAPDARLAEGMRVDLAMRVGGG